MQTIKRTLFILILSLLIANCKRSSTNSEESVSSDTIKISDTKIQDTLINKTSDTLTTQDKNEDKIVGSILSLPEVKERADYIEKNTNGERHLQVMIVQTPDESEEKCYVVKAGEDNGTNFVTHFTFYVSPDKYTIRYYDAINDTTLSLESWRQQIKSSK
jgi:hypothetical protein